MVANRKPKKYYKGEDYLNLPMGLQFSMFYSLENGSWVLLAEGRLASYETTTAAATIDFQTKVVSSKANTSGERS